jgi:ABC-type multidrug transport system fused ATPase/permease subunit
MSGEDSAQDTAYMTLAITQADRYQVLAGYHHDIFSAVEKKQFQRAMRLLFAFAEDYCLNFESDVAALSEEYHGIIDESSKQTPDPLPFLQAFHRLWIAMEDYVLAGFRAATTQESASEIAVGAARSEEPLGYTDGPVDLKKAILLRNSVSQRPLVQLKDATIRFGTSDSAFKLGPITLQVPQGQIIGIVGPNGSGKTTLLRLIAADLMQSSGDIDFPGLRYTGSTDFIRIHGFWPPVRSKIAYVPPSPAPISENTEVTLWLTGAAHGIPFAQLEHQISVVMHKYGLNQYSDRLVSELSTG